VHPGDALKDPGQGELRELFIHDTPLLDLRAPTEFSAGAFPASTNIPILNDEERSRVGRCYKEHGQQAAIALGHRLVSGDTRQRRIAAWVDYYQQHPAARLYCFRGGLRSQIAQQWLGEAHCPLPRIPGGYKSMRRFLLQSLEELPSLLPLVVIGGRTGTGKTRLLSRLGNRVDLEAIARHRGSGFGRLPQAQPGQIDFENTIAVELLKLHAGDCQLVGIEDEGRNIGNRATPTALYQRMQQAPIYLLQVPLPERVQNILREYVVEASRQYIDVYGEETGFSRYAAQLRESLDRIRKRLGGSRHQTLAAIMDRALLQQARDGDLDAHKHWISTLLTDYYDPMYDFQLERKRSRIVSMGNADTLLWAIRKRYPQAAG